VYVTCVGGRPYDEMMACLVVTHGEGAERLNLHDNHESTGNIKAEQQRKEKMNLMNFKKDFLILLSLISVLALSSCGLIQGEDAVAPTPTLTPTSQSTQPPTLQETAAQVIQALAEKDLEATAQFVHPEMGVRFSPYAYVREEHQVFIPDELVNLEGSAETYTWGRYDGTGEPIEMTFDEYYVEFVYSADFANPESTAVNARIGQGNSLNNIHEFFPGSSFVEYHFSGFEKQYEGMDWQSLRLVFIQEDGVWFLVGIVHDEWTI
jgi:hypothetical protein